jgi:uncharacterized protein DUF4913
MTSPGPGERNESADDIRFDEESVGRPAELYYPNVAEFVTSRLVHFYALPPEAGLVWCPSWFRHAQALSRLDAVWRAWEHLRLDPALGISNWWTNYADPNMRALMDPVSGPFARCVNGHQDNEPLPTDQVPDGLFLDQRARWPLPADPLDFERSRLSTTD